MNAGDFATYCFGIAMVLGAISLIIVARSY